MPEPVLPDPDLVPAPLLLRLAGGHRVTEVSLTGHTGHTRRSHQRHCRYTRNMAGRVGDGDTETPDDGGN